nr:zf-HC2 domain-containing protein [Lachnospiraceae bacterium C1.1]
MIRTMVKDYGMCKDVENLLQPYLENKLNIEQMRVLHSHIIECADCYDELEIRYLLMEGLRHLEDGETLDLKKELDDRLYKTKQRVLFADRIQAIVFILEGVAGFLTLVNLILFFL